MLARTRADLAEWGKWARGGLPTVSSMFAAIMGGPRGAPVIDPPEYIDRIDTIVRKAEPDDRQILVVRYCWKGSGKEKSRMLGLPQRAYYYKLERAEWYVHTELD